MSVPLPILLCLGVVLLTIQSTTLFAADLVPGASKLLVVSPQAFRDTCLEDIAKARDLAARFKVAQSPADPLAALDEYDSAIALLADASARASLARSVHPDQAMRAAASACESDVDKANTDLTLDRGVYDRMAGLALGGADAPTRHYVERTLRDFRRAGVDKDEATRGRIKALREELVTLGQQFDENIASDVRTIELDPRDLDGLPDDFKRSHAPGPNGKVTLTTNNTDYQPFLTYASSSTARAALWKLYRLRGHPKNVPVLARMLVARQELAAALGFPTWADYITGDKMIGTRRNVGEFIDRIVSAAERRMNADYAALVARRQRDVPGETSVDAWDSGYYQEKVKAEQYQLRLAVGPPLLRVLAGQGGRHGYHEPAVRDRVQAGEGRGRCGIRRSRPTTSTRLLRGTRIWDGSTWTCSRATTSTSTTRSSR